MIPAAPVPADLEALFNTSEYFDLSAMSPVQPGSDAMQTFAADFGGQPIPYDRLDSLAPGTNDIAGDTTGNGAMPFDYAMSGGFGGENLAGEGMDSVSDGLQGNDAQQGL